MQQKVHIVSNENNKHKKNRHGSNAKTCKVKSKPLKLFSTNGAGVVYGKIDCLVSEVKATGSTAVTVQETHCRRKGRIQFEDMVVFEAIRAKKGGGTLCAIQKDLNPKLVEEYNDDFS